MEREEERKYELQRNVNKISPCSDFKLFISSFCDEESKSGFAYSFNKSKLFRTGSLAGTSYPRKL
jgi:hypothetical protein